MERRKIYMVDKKLQYGFLKAVLIPLLAGGASLYYLIYAVVSRNMMIIPENVIENLLPPLRTVNIILLAVVPILVFFMTKWAIFISNRIAGPIYRLKQDLDKVAKGDMSIRFKFRKDDHFFHPIADKLNTVLDR